MEIDYDCLRTGTAIGFHAFRELCSNFLLWETYHRAMERHPPYGITQCYMPPDTAERALS